MKELRAFRCLALAGIFLLATPLAAQELQPFPFSEPLEFAESGELEEDEIETDRDSFTPATAVAGCRRLIFESAWSFIDNRDVPDTNSLPEIVARCGVNDWLELRLGWNWEAGGAANSTSGNTGDDEPEELFVESESALLYGFKAALTSQNDWLPQSALIVQAFTPTSGEETATDLVATYVVGWQMANGWKWDSAIRYATDSAEGDHANLWAPSTVVKIPVGEQWNLHAEYFGIFSDGRSDGESVLHYFSPGVHYLVTPDYEIGIRVGWGLNDQAANFFSNVGLGLRY